MNRVVILRLCIGLLMVGLVASLMPLSIAATQTRDMRALGKSGLPLPRFVSINKSAANVRRGPGEDYPLLWQYQRRGLPLEIIAEYGQWRRVRDHEDSEGWMHARLLRGPRQVMVRTAVNVLILRRRADTTAGIVALVQPGAIGRLEDCEGDWCEIDVGGHDGWLRRDALWGVYPFEYRD